MSYTDRFLETAAPDLSAYLPFLVDGQIVGYVKPDFGTRLKEFPDVFTVSDTLGLADGLSGFDDRTTAIADVLQALRESGEISGWRSELYPVGTSFTAPPLFHMERAAAATFGIIGYGVHLNGIVPTSRGLSMWIGKRSLDKPTAPGKLDQIVAGGQPAGLSLSENLVKECQEEADIPAQLSLTSVPVGAITYVTERPEGLRRDVLYVYDLVLPDGFIPRNTDGEIESFQLMDIVDVMKTVHDTSDFKFNCALVVIDFLIRHGMIEPDHPEYLNLLNGLHRL